MPRSSLVLMLIRVALALSIARPALAEIRYVNTNLAAGADDGTSWFNAFRGPDALQNALAAAVPGDELWVAQGTYRPTTTSDRAVSFTLPSGVTLYGGFFGFETDLSQRLPDAYVVTLSGDIGTAGDDTDNSFHVVDGSSADATAVLDGFRIAEGNTNGAPFLEEAGGGAYINGGAPTFVGCRFEGNRSARVGGAVYALNAAPTFFGCAFVGNSLDTNTLDEEGGALAAFHSSMTITDCEFSGNSATGGGHGGAIRAFDSPITVLDSVFSSNMAGEGGAVSMDFPTGATITGCTFDGNTAYSKGGAILMKGPGVIEDCMISGNTAVRGAGLYLDGGSPTVLASTIVNNAALGEETFGGGIYVNGTALVQGCVVESNHVGWYGGGIYLGAYYSGTIEACTIQNNTAQNDGGGIYAAAEFFEIRDTDVLYNDAINGEAGGLRVGGAQMATIVGGSIVGNTADDQGGGVFTQDSTIEFVGTLIAANSASNNGGGMINVDSTPYIVNCEFDGNSAASWWGGGLYDLRSVGGAIVNSAFRWNTAARGAGIYQLQSETMIASCTVIGNTAFVAGGGLRMYEGDLSVRNSIIWGNSGPEPDVSNLSTGNATFLSCDLGGSGGSGAGWNAAYGTDGGGNIDADPMLDAYGRPGLCSPVTDAGDPTLLTADAADLDDDGDVAEDVPLDLDGSARIIGATVDIGAYEAAATETFPRLYVDASRPAGGTGETWATALDDLATALETAAASGGIVQEIWVAAGTYRPDGSTCAAAADDRDRSFHLAAGVAIYGGFAGDEAQLSQRDPAANVTILSGDVGIPGDETDNVRHVVRATNIDETTILDGFTITGGYADGSSFEGRGAGIVLWNASPIFRGCTIVANAATGGGAGLDVLVGSVANFEACRFEANAATGPFGIAGAATLFGNPVNFTDCEFVGNTAPLAGGAVTSPGAGTFLRCRFAGNESAKGGAVSMTTPGAVFDSCVFESNLATGARAGAIDIDDGGDVTLVNCRFIGNQATAGQAGAVYGGYAAVTMIGCAFSGNRSFDHGGAIVMNQSVADIENCSLSRNESEAIFAGLYAYGSSDITVVNSILHGNIDAGGGQNAQVFEEDSILDIDFSCVEGWDGTLGGLGNIGDDPLFVDPDGVDDLDGTADDDLRLVAGSPAIDGGFGTTPPPGAPTDLDGNPRVVDGDENGSLVIDMGAYEFQPDACPADLDGSGDVAFADILVLLGAWGPCSGCPADLDGSGDVGFGDLLLLLGAWGSCP